MRSSQSNVRTVKSTNKCVVIIYSKTNVRTIKSTNEFVVTIKKYL
jgi:hypothetical protein